MRANSGHRTSVTIRQVQGGGDGSVPRSGKRDKGFGQKPYLPEIHHDRLPVLVDAEVAGVHVGLGEHEAITAHLDGRELLPGRGVEQRVRLYMHVSERCVGPRENERQTHSVHVPL